MRAEPKISQKITRGQVLGLTAASLGYFLDGFDFALMIFIVTDVAREFKLSLAVASSLVGAAFTTRWLAGPLIGSISDRYGRRAAMMISACLYSLGTAACGISWNYWSLLIFRAVVGVGMAGEYSSSSAYALEVTPPRLRNTAVAILLTVFALGSAAAAQIYPLIVPHFGWRALMYVGAAPVAILLILLFLAPESEDWKRSRASAAGRRPSGLEIISSRWWGVTTYLCVGVLGLYLANMPVMILMPTYLKGVGYTPAQVGQIHSLGAIGTALGALGSGLLADRFGTRRVICWSLIVSMFLLAPVFAASRHSFAVTGGLMLILMMLMLGVGGIMPKWVAEHYPIPLRGAGIGTVYNIGALGGFVGPSIAAYFSRAFGLSQSIIGSALVFVVFTVLIVALDLPRRMMRPATSPGV